jgi:hypothetical protein
VGIQVGDDGIASSESEELEIQPVEDEREAPSEERAEGEQPEVEKPEEKPPLPKELSKMLREIKEQQPERAGHVRELQTAYYQRNGYREAFSTVDDARNAKATLDALGGEEGIVDLQTLKQEVDVYDEMVASGNPKVVEAWWDEGKEGLIKLAPVVLGKIEAENPAAFEAIARPFFVKSVLQSGIVESVNTVMEFLGDEANPYAQRELTKIVNWLRGMQNEYQGLSKKPEIDPRMQALELERENLRQAESQRRDQDINDKIARYVFDGINEGLRPLLKGRDLSKEAMNDLIMGIGHEIQNSLDADRAYQKNFEALKRTGDINRIVSYSRARIDSIKQRAVNAVYTRRYGNALPAARKTTPTTTTRTTNTTQPRPAVNAAPLMVPQKPTIDQIDWSKDPEQIMYMTGKAYLKSGKFVSWRKAR